MEAVLFDEVLYQGLHSGVLRGQGAPVASLLDFVVNLASNVPKALGKVFAF